MEIFKLFGSVLVDNTEANKSISKTSDEAEGLGSKFKDGIKTAAKWAAGVVAGATAVGTAMVAAAKSTASELDVIDKASQRMGIAAESYQELAYAANLSGVEMSTMEKAAKKLEGMDLNLDDALAQIMGIEDEAERTAAACDLFGESVAYQMTPLINAGAEGMDEMRKEAHDLGLVMSGEAVKNGAAMNDMFTKVDQSIATLKNGLVSELMPYVMEILQWVIDNIPMIKETVGNVMDAIIPIVKPILDAVMSFLPPMLAKIKAFMDWLIPYIEPIINGVVGIVEAIFKLLSGDIDGFVDGIVEVFTNLGPTMLKMGEEIFSFLWEGIKNVWANISGWVTDKVDWLKDKLSFWKSSGEYISGKDGSHAAGLNYVPYDGYVAELHKGETVLNAGSTQGMVSDIINGIKDKVGGGNSGPIELSINLDGRTIAHQLYPSLQYEQNRRGPSLA